MAREIETNKTVNCKAHSSVHTY